MTQTAVTSMRFACRRRTAASWTSTNEVLLLGEIGYETDTDKFKIGDGVTPWNSISGYFSKTGGGGSSVWGGITGTYADQTDAVAADAAAQAAAIAAAATDATAKANAAQAYAIQRANHTGTQAQSTITNLVSDLALKADLVGGVVPSSQIPAIAITEYLGSVSSQAAMLALSGQKGDWAIRSDLSMVYIITGNDPTVLADWTGLAYPTAPVLSVNGQTGAVTLSKSDIGLGNVENTALSTWAGSSNLTTLGTIGTGTWQGTAVGVSYGGTGATSQSGARTNLGLVIGTDVQAYDADLAAIAALTPADNDVLQRKSGAWTNRTIAQLVADLGVPTLAGANTWTAQNTFAAGTITTSQPFTISQAWNAGGVTFTGKLNNFTDNASASASIMEDWQIGGASKVAFRKDGRIVAAIGLGNANSYFDFSSGSAVWKYFGTSIITIGSGNLDLTAAVLRYINGASSVECLGTITTVASAATIGPITAPVAFISGTTAIDTLTPTSNVTGGSSTGQFIDIIPTGVFTWTTAGNFAIAGTAVVGRLLRLAYSKATSKWYPSYI